MARERRFPRALADPHRKTVVAKRQRDVLFNIMTTVHTTTSKASSMVRRARGSARLSQRALAASTGIDQAAIARIERGSVQPRADTLERLLRASGWELRASPVSVPDIDRSAIRRAIAMSDRERESYFLESNRNIIELLDDARLGT
jgi:transcriptional regulator with XRE-family HTH domain